MMNIREYFDNLYNLTNTEYEFDEIVELEYAVYEMDEDDFEIYCSEHNIDLTARDERTGELVVTLWGWDMCGD